MSFRTTTEVMQATAGRVDNVNDQVQGELNRLRGTVDGLRGAWQGDAQLSFHALMERWNESATELRRRLEDVAPGADVTAYAADGMAELAQIGVE